jgi:hypothetical protein
MMVKDAGKIFLAIILTAKGLARFPQKPGHGEAFRSGHPQACSAISMQSQELVSFSGWDRERTGEGAICA